MSERDSNEKPSFFLLYLVFRHLRTNPLEMCGSCCFTLKQTAYRMAVLFDIIVAEV